LNLENTAVKQLRRVARLEPSEVPIMLVAAGVIPERVNVAASIRRRLDEVLEVI
jgi:hypothetical protein